MPTNFVKGDVLEEANSGMGKRALAFGAEIGIAVAVRKRWPAFAAALEATKGKGVQPGEVFAWSDGDLEIYALGIQRGGAHPKVPWVERSVRTALARAEGAEIRRVLIPRFGGDWTRMKKLLGEIGGTTTIDLVIFEQFIRTPEGAAERLAENVASQDSEDSASLARAARAKKKSASTMKKKKTLPEKPATARKEAGAAPKKATAAAKKAKAAAKKTTNAKKTATGKKAAVKKSGATK